jgi:hypothetical protein
MCHTLVCSASVYALVSALLSYAVFISHAVWSAVAQSSTFNSVRTCVGVSSSLSPDHAVVRHSILFVATLDTTSTVDPPLAFIVGLSGSVLSIVMFVPPTTDSSLLSSAVCVAVDTGLFASLVLSTLPSPTSLAVTE